MYLSQEVKEGLNEKSLNMLSQHLVVPMETVHQGMDMLIPVSLAALLKKGAACSSLRELSGIFTGNTHSVEHMPEMELVADDPALLKQGRSLLQELFGAFSTPLNRAVYEAAGLNPTQSMGFLTLSMPVIMYSVDYLIARKGWSVPMFYHALFEEKEQLSLALPPSLTQELDLSGLAYAPFSDGQRAEMRQERTVINPAEAEDERMMPAQTGREGSFLKWLIIVAIIAIVIWGLWSRGIITLPSGLNP